MNREPAYAEVVAGLLDATPPTATERFDEALAEAVANGLDPATARTLRWWHRESVRAVRDHASTVLPPVIAGLVASDAAAHATEPPAAIAIAPEDDPASDKAPSDEAAPDSPEPDELTAPDALPAREARRRTLVASLRSLDDSATA